MKVLVLGGGADQVALIKELQARGNEVVLLDYLPNPPAKQCVSKHIQESTLDINAVKNAAIRENAELICTACTDQALLTVAQVSEMLNLPCYIPYSTALDVTNKLYMKTKMWENAIPTALFTTVTSPDELDKTAEFSYPLVIKPADCNSSKGVRKIEDKTSLNKIVDEALSLSRTHTAIIEEFKTGEEISADFYIENNDVKLLSATTSFKIGYNDRFTILGSRYPAITESQEQELLEIGRKIAKAFNLSNCPLLVQLIFDGNQFWVIEFSARMGGGSKYKLIEVLSGVNIMSKYVDLILGEKPVVSPSKMVNHATMQYVYCNNGRIAEFENFEELKRRGIITEYFYYKQPGAVIEKVETSSDRPAGFLVTGNSEAEVAQKLAVADDNLRIIDDNGNDIMIHHLK